MRYRRNNESRKGSWSPHSITCGHSVNLAAAFGPLACDICQQIWCEVWQGIRANTLPYLMPGLLVYKADSRIKDHHRRIARLTQLDPAKHDRADRLNMDQRIDHKTALAAIPDDERYIFILCFREGLTQEEVAARLAVSTRTVRRKLDAALTHVQGFLRGETADPGTIAV